MTYFLYTTLKYYKYISLNHWMLRRTSWRVKLTTLAMEVVRRMTNTDRHSTTKDRTDIFTTFVVKMIDSGYEKGSRKEIIKAGLIKYYRMIKDDIVGTRSLHRSSEELEGGRERKIMESRTWFCRRRGGGGAQGDQGPPLEDKTLGVGHHDVQLGKGIGSDWMSHNRSCECHSSCDCPSSSNHHLHRPNHGQQQHRPHQHRDNCLRPAGTQGTSHGGGGLRALHRQECPQEPPAEARQHLLRNPQPAENQIHREVGHNRGTQRGQDGPVGGGVAVRQESVLALQHPNPSAGEGADGQGGGEEADQDQGLPGPPRVHPGVCLLCVGLPLVLGGGQDQAVHWQVVKVAYQRGTEHLDAVNVGEAGHPMVRHSWQEHGGKKAEF
jgi:hypothetical protein